MNTTAANAGMLEIVIDAAATSHDLTGFEPIVDDDGRAGGYQAICRNCGLTARVGNNGVMYTLLANSCPGEVPVDE